MVDDIRALPFWERHFPNFLAVIHGSYAILISGVVHNNLIHFTLQRYDFLLIPAIFFAQVVFYS